MSPEGFAWPWRRTALKAAQAKWASKRRSVLITGASSGIGLALSRRLLRAGHEVYAVARGSEALEGLRSDGAQVRALDLRASEAEGSLQEWLQGIALDGAVHAAGEFLAGGEDAGDAALAEMPQSHVLTTQHCLRGVRAALRPNSRVLTLGAATGRAVTPELLAYGVAKAAQESLAAVWRRGLAREGVALTHLLLGRVDTPMLRHAPPPGPGERVVSADEVAAQTERLLADPRPLATFCWPPELRWSFATAPFTGALRRDAKLMRRRAQP